MEHDHHKDKTNENKTINKNNTVPFAEDNFTHNIKQLQERKLDRRGFMKTLVGAAGVFAVSTLPWGALAMRELSRDGEKQYAEKEIVKLDDVKVGEAVQFTYPSEHHTALLIRTGEQDVVAYQNACTHLLCPVFWDKGKEKLVCPCHHGFFDVTTGQPTAGPPQRPLPQITLTVKQGTVYATGVKRYET
ncbi:Rieske 2Fe-2S domain-containing protein [Longirhabdus pacifica]|uniref:Rieske 2Fe-2S domain-containing protein n=1 Tax=Longirhabdus pacifica TaxID=2305227 RepID=UPI001008BCD7|nr:Rieske 2Fe-2S domain-containing protein [Longirhabdus pacifica]